MYLEELGKLACSAKYELNGLSTEAKNNALNIIAECIIEDEETILASNALDIANAYENNMHQGLIDRLSLDPKRIKAIAEGIKIVATLPDPIGQVIEEFERPNGLKLKKVRVPLGVIGIIYESRPNVTADAFALCFKSGNCCILKGGKDAINSNIAITASIKKGLVKAGLNPNSIVLIEKTDRETTTQFMKLNKYVDVLIPRGSASLIKATVENSTIPVIETGSGNCHIFVDESADFDMAIDIIFNAKTQRIGVCNAAESLLVHSNIIDSFMPKLKERLDTKNVEIRGDQKCQASIECAPATEEDYYTEYLDYILSVKTVDSVEEAIAHINEHNTKHSDCIVTKSDENAEKFMLSVDSSCVYVNASTRFTDGFEFGFGAEIGISTQKIHARGPMGLKELTSYKYLIKGNGQIRG